MEQKATNTVDLKSKTLNLELPALLYNLSKETKRRCKEIDKIRDYLQVTGIKKIYL